MIHLRNAGNGRMLAAVLLVDVVEHLLPTMHLEVDIDIRGFRQPVRAGFGEKSLEEENQRCKEKSCESGSGLYSRPWTPSSWTVTVEPQAEKKDPPKDEWQCGEQGSGGG